jgi:hypothetical protein
LAAFSAPDRALAQRDAEKSPDRSSDKSFSSLRDERDAVHKDIGEIDKPANDLQSRQYWLKEEAASKRDLAELEKEKKGSPEKLTALRKKIADSRTNSAGKKDGKRKASKRR